MAQLPPGVDPSKVPFIPPPAGQLSNFINPHSLAPVIEGIGGILIAIETILLFLRTCSNVKTFGKLRLEDYWVIFAAFLTFGYFAILLRLRLIALHAWDVPLTVVTEALYETIFAQNMMLGPTVFFSKSSLLLLLYRIFSPDRMFRYKVYGAFVFIAVTSLCAIPMYLALCLPKVGGSWLEAGSGKKFYLPASVISHLHLPLQRKIGILAIFMTGMLAVVASVVGLVFRIRLNHDADVTWAAYIVELCTMIDCCVSIICSCMPAIPAISKLVATNSYFTTVRSRLLSRFASTDKLKSSKVSRRKGILSNRNLNESEPYIELIESGPDHLNPDLVTKTNIQHVPRSKLPDNLGINMSVELEVVSTKSTSREPSKA